MTQRAQDALDRLKREEWASFVVVHLVRAARAHQRASVLRTERAAERRTTKVTAEDWRHWREDQCRVAGLPAHAEPAEIMRAAVARFKADLRVQWTEDLLRTHFALSDGTKVTWGDATVRQHQERLSMFQEQSKHALEGAARHQSAIDTLQEANATCLNDVCLQAV